MDRNTGRERRISGEVEFHVGRPGEASVAPPPGRTYNFTFRNRNEFAITETELKLIAAAARIGLSSNPNTGYSTPAAIGTPIAL